MYMDEKLDTGPIIEVMPVPLLETDTAATLHSKAMAAVPTLFAKHIQKIVNSEVRVPATAQTGEAHFFGRPVVCNGVG